MRGVVMLLVCGLGGCTTTYPGLGDDLDAELEDTSSSEDAFTNDDVIFPTEDTATKTDSGLAKADASVDASMVDSKTVDGVDSSATDSGVASDSGLVDGEPVDSGPVDSGPVDAGPPILSSNPGQVYCDVSGSKNVLCPAGQICCGKQPLFGSFSWSCSTGACDAPFAGDSRTYKCNEKADCGGFLCCVDRNFWGTMVGTKCHSDTSPCGDETACMSDADCPSGKCKEATITDGDFSIGMCK